MIEPNGVAKISVSIPAGAKGAVDFDVEDDAGNYETTSVIVG